jgi:16S rRNA C967 or C1407 C5-methylase (RsmB/RsmF family)
MNEFLIASDVLYSILHEKKSFTDAMKHHLSLHKLDNQSIGLIRSLASCHLHHEILLKHLVNRFFPTIEDKIKLSLEVIVGNHVFIKRISDQESILAIQNLLRTLASPEDIQLFMDAIKPGVSLIDPEIKEGSVFHLSLKFNTPEWLIAMWIKHFGLSITLKILQSNHKPVLQACRVNDRKINRTSFLSKFPEFTAGPVLNTVIYKGKEPLKNHPAFKDSLVFQQRLAVSDTINQFNFENVHGEILLVETRPQALYLELPLFTHERILINVITNAIDRKLSMQKALSHFDFKRVSVFEAEPQNIITHIAKKQDVVMVVPQCSKFDLIRSLPDFFAHFNQSQLDDLIKQQYEMLTISSQFVEHGGMLMYSVNTLNLKEGKHLIADFLSAHPEFSLISEFQHFPFDPLNTALYVAALRKAKA